MKKKFYLAYGSNLNVHQMAWRCPGADAAGIATLQDYRLLFRGSGSGAYLTIEPYIGGDVPLGVWSITEEDEKALDRYEGYPHFYRKETLSVEMDNFLIGKRSTVEALVYIMDESRLLGVPSRAYLATCIQGYHDFGFDLQPLADAVALARREVTK